MSDEANQLTDQETEATIRARNTFRASVIITVASMAILLLYIYILAIYDISQVIVPLGAIIGLILAGLVSMGLNRYGRSLQAAWLLIAGPLLVAVVITTAVTDIGIALGIAATFVAAQIAAQTLPRRQLSRAIIISIAAGFATVLLDLFWPGKRLTIPEVQTVIPVISILVVLVLGYFYIRQYKNYTIRTKLITATFAMAAIAVSTVTFSIIRTTSDVLTQNAGRDLNSLAQSQALAVGELLSRQLGVLQTLSLNPTLQNKVRLANATNAALYSDPTAAAERIAQRDKEWAAANDSDVLITRHLKDLASVELRRFQAAFPSHVEVFITDKYGLLAASTQRTSDYYQADERWWQEAFNDGQGNIYIGSPQFDQSSRTFAVDIAVPLYDANTADVIGVLHTAYQARRLTDMLSFIESGQTTYSDFLLPSNQFLASSGLGLKDVPPETVAQLQELQSKEFAQFEYNGEMSLVSTATVNTLGGISAVDTLEWVIVVHQDRDESLAAVETQERTLILIGLAVLVFTSAIAAFVAQTLTGPITRLTDVATQIEAGDLSVRATAETGDEIGKLATTFNNMTIRLQETLAGLEQRVAERTQALKTSTEVSRRLSTILDQEQLLSEVVEQVRGAFNYYHAHIYLFDQTGNNLVMMGGTGAAGKAMLESGHSIPKGKGLVGQAADTNSVVLVANVSQAEGWLPNPLLLETRAEVAVPIAVGDEVMGVLDVQHNVVGGLTEANVDVIQSIANQTAVALQNARSYGQTQDQANRELLINEINQKILSTTDMEQAMQVAIRELGRAVGAQQTSVRLGTSQAGNGSE